MNGLIDAMVQAGTKSYLYDFDHVIWAKPMKRKHPELTFYEVLKQERKKRNANHQK